MAEHISSYLLLDIMTISPSVVGIVLALVLGESALTLSLLSQKKFEVHRNRRGALKVGIMVQYVRPRAGFSMPSPFLLP